MSTSTLKSVLSGEGINDTLTFINVKSWKVKHHIDPNTGCKIAILEAYADEVVLESDDLTIANRKAEGGKKF